MARKELSDYHARVDGWIATTGWQGTRAAAIQHLVVCFLDAFDFLAGINAQAAREAQAARSPLEASRCVRALQDRVTARGARTVYCRQRC